MPCSSAQEPLHRPPPLQMMHGAVSSRRREEAELHSLMQVGGVRRCAGSRLFASAHVPLCVHSGWQTGASLCLRM